MCRSGRSMRDLFSGITCLFCIGLLLPMAKHCAGARITPPVAALTVPSSIARTVGHMNLQDPFYSSKRRVPNGPDPIHNRRAGKSGRPPGRA